MKSLKPLFLRRTAWAVAAAATLLGCSQTTLDLLSRSFIPVSFDKPAMVQSVVQTVILPDYAAFVRDSESLQKALEALNASPDATRLEAARSAWQTAAARWAHTEAYQFGPAEDQRLRQQIAYWPRRESHIQEVLSGTDSLSDLKAQGATRKGLPVIEYLLFGEPSAQLLTPSGTRACRYLQALGVDLLAQARQVDSLWRSTYASQYASDSAALNRQLNQWIMLLETTRNQRLGAPLGDKTGGTPDPAAVEAPDSGRSLDLLENVLAGFAVSYSGGMGQGVDDYLIAQGMRRLDTQIRSQLEQSRTALTAIDQPLEEALLKQKNRVETLQASLQELLRLVKVDLANGLNETVHFNSNDGD